MECFERRERGEARWLVAGAPIKVRRELDQRDQACGSLEGKQDGRQEFLSLFGSWRRSRGAGAGL